jgi:hypothetical protein
VDFSASIVPATRSIKSLGVHTSLATLEGHLWLMHACEWSSIMQAWKPPIGYNYWGGAFQKTLLLSEGIMFP